MDGIGECFSGVADPRPGNARRRLLDEGKSADKLGKMPDRNAGDREVFDSAQRRDAPIGLRRNLPLAEKVVLPPCRDARKFDRAGHCEREGGSGVPSWRRTERFEMFFCHEG